MFATNIHDSTDVVWMQTRAFGLVMIVQFSLSFLPSLDFSLCIFHVYVLFEEDNRKDEKSKQSKSIDDRSQKKPLVEDRTLGLELIIIERFRLVFVRTVHAEMNKTYKKE